MNKHLAVKTWAILISICLLTGCTGNSVVKEPEYWPTDGWQSSTPEAQGMSSETLADMFEKIDDYNYDFHHILIIRNGYKVAECNYYPYEKDDLHIVNSITKNITATLIGQAIEDGYIKSVEDRLFDYFQDQTYQNMTTDKSNICIKELLTMTSGIQWEENGDYSSPTNSSKMMWKSENQLDYVLNLPVEKSLVGIHNYSTGSSHLLSGILSRATGKTASNYAKEKLWMPLGIDTAYWATDKQGINTGGSRSFYTAEDLAKIGFLYLNNGKWEQTQLIPKKWVESSTSKHVDTPKGPAGLHGYGYQWWMNPFGGYSGRGYNGQYLFVLPEENIVAVFYGALSGSNFFLPEKFMETYVLKSIMSDGPVKENQAGEMRLNKVLTSLSAIPPAVTPSELPDISAVIEDKTFDVENNQTIAISFDKSNSEAVVNWYSDGIMNKIRVGLDGQYRFSDCQNFYLDSMTSKVAARGGWKNDNTFNADIRIIEADTVYSLTVTFDKDKASVTFTPN